MAYQPSLDFKPAAMRTADLAEAIKLGYLNFDNVVDSYRDELRARLVAMEVELRARRTK